MKRPITICVISVLLIGACLACFYYLSTHDLFKTDSSTVSTEPVVMDNRSKNETTRQYDEQIPREVEQKKTETEFKPVTNVDFETKGFIYENMIGDTLYFYVVKNNSQSDVEVNGNAVAYDQSGNPIGADTSEIDALGAGETSIMMFYFDNVKGIQNIECSLSFNKLSYFFPVIGNIKLEETVNERNVTIKATNTGDINANFLEAYALFFDADNKLVAYETQYITDNDFELKPGESLTVQLDARKDFDHVECYLTGRSTGKASSTDKGIADSDFEVKEYLYESGYGSSRYFLAVKNNGEMAVGLDINMTAFDASGNVLGADSGTIEVLEPGEESIAQFIFESVTGIDHVEYKFGYDTTPFFSSGLKDLDFVENKNKKNVVVTVTNHGTEASKFIEAHALFLDSSGKVIAYDEAYFTDGDYELKPGASLTEQLDSRKSYDSVVVYYTARRGDF